MTENTQTERDRERAEKRESVAKNGTGNRGGGGVELAWAGALLILCAN